MTAEQAAALPSSARRPRSGLLATVLVAGLAAAVYFVTAHLALALQSRPEGIAIFWPAAGIGVGLMLGLDRRERWPIALGVVAGTLVANVVRGRHPGLSVAFGAINAAEALLVAWGLDWLTSRTFSMQRLAHVMRFLALSLLACAVTAAAAAAMIVLVGASTASPVGLWRVWMLSDVIGILVVAPLAAAVVALVRHPQPHHDWTKDIALLMLLLAFSWSAVTATTALGHWQALAPGTTVVPVVVWLAARGQPLAPAAGVVLIGAIMAVAVATGMGRFGDPTIDAQARIMAAQASLAVLSLIALGVSALFHERRDAEARLRTTRARLATIAGAAPGIMFSLARNAAGRLHFPFLAPTAPAVLGMHVGLLADDAGPLLDRLSPADRANLLAALDRSGSDAGAFRLELAYRHPDEGQRWIELCAAPAGDEAGGTVWHGYAQDVTGRRIMTEELNHRTRNLLSVVQSVVHHTARTSEPAQFADVLVERMGGLLRCHDLLDAREWQSIALADVARSQLAHLAGLVGSRIVLEGPELHVEPGAAQILGMSLHELATNAMKHGALSGDTGSVRLAWSVRSGTDGPRLEIVWEEIGGPPVAAPTRQGFGQRVMIDMVRYQLDADVSITYRPAGILWHVDAPADQVLTGPVE